MNTRAPFLPQKSAAFYRSPRITREITPITLAVEDPPQKKEVQDTPTILRIGPSVGMALASAMMGLYMVSNMMGGQGNMLRALPMLGMMVTMILGAVLWPNLSKRYEKKKQAKEESVRRAAYAGYLDTIRRVLIHETALQKEILEENRITPYECIRLLAAKDRRLFDRISTHADFLDIRMGKGDVALAIDLTFPQEKLSLEEDVLKDLLRALKEEERLVRDVPVALSLTDDYITGVVGSTEDTYPFIRGLIAQIATLHAPDEVKIVYLGDENYDSEFRFIRTLPHLFDDTKAFRYLATTQEGARDISLKLERELQSRLGITEQRRPGDWGIYYVVVMAPGASDISFDALASLCALRTNKGFSVITFAEDIRSLPKECTRIIELEGNKAESYDPKDATGKRDVISLDSVLSKAEARAFALHLGRIPLESAKTKGTLPSSLGILEMFEAGKVEHLNIASRWKESDPTLSLAAPLGKDAQGMLSLLDVHEDVHGPHGLIAGMTGSGKSETIITYILSLAINFRPDEVSFVLIDYKGGGLAGAFDNTKARLPHLSGTITNLDGSAIARSLISIKSELKRRQALFNDAREKAGASTIDIYKYQRMRRQGIVTEAIPHLFIIADEFAELKSQEPAFMDELISAARIGRSLGIHLVLATQKPSGVVNDQIWSNSRFKICLKVADAADSKEMLKRPEAAEITDAGRYYLMVGYNEYFTLGQSAWSGTPYVAKESYEAPKDDALVLISSTARPLMQIKPKRQQGKESGVPESVVILDHLVEVAKEEGYTAPRLWLDPLPEHITVDELEKKYPRDKADPFTLDPIIGEYDDPANQAKGLLTLPLTEGGNTVIYGMEGSGIERQLTTLIYSLITHHDASTLNLYILDFGAETLGVFRDAPEVGEVVFGSEEEKTERLFALLEKEMARRKKLLSVSSTTFHVYNKDASEPLASTVVIMNNMAAFYELYPKLEERLTSLTREANRYGIYFIVTADAFSTLRMRLKNNFKQSIILSFTEPTDYISVLGPLRGMHIPKGYGRGLVKRDDTVYEYQTASITSEEDEIDAIRAYVASKRKDALPKAPSIRLLPEKLTPEMLVPGTISTPNLPFGLMEATLEEAVLDFSENPVQRVLYTKNKDGRAFVKALLRLAEARQSHYTPLLIDRGYALQQDHGFTGREVVTEDEIRELIEHIMQKEAGAEKPYLLIMSGIATLFTQLGAALSESFKAYLKHLRPNGGASFLLFDNITDATYNYDDWAKVQLSNKNGLWIGEGIGSQTAYTPNPGMSNMVDPKLVGDRGYQLITGNLNAVKCLTEETEKNNE